MRRSTLRAAVALAVLAALLLPAASPAQETPLLSRFLPETGLFAGLRDLLVSLVTVSESENGWQIDPDGAAATDCDNRSQIDPNGGSSCTTNDNRSQIDPDG